MFGNLIVKPMSGLFLRDTDFFKKMDPYVILKLENQTFKTKTAKNAGKKPVWNDTFYFNKLTDNKYIEFEVWDEDTFTPDDLIGKGSLPLYNVDSVSIRVVPVIYKGKNAGEVTFRIELLPDKNGN